MRIWPTCNCGNREAQRPDQTFDYVPVLLGGVSRDDQSLARERLRGIRKQAPNMSGIETQGFHAPAGITRLE